MKVATQNFNSNQGFAGLQASANAVNLSNISTQVDEGLFGGPEDILGDTGNAHWVFQYEYDPTP